MQFSIPQLVPRPLNQPIHLTGAQACPLQQDLSPPTPHAQFQIPRTQGTDLLVDLAFGPRSNRPLEVRFAHVHEPSGFHPGPRQREGVGGDAQVAGRGAEGLGPAVEIRVLERAVDGGDGPEMILQFQVAAWIQGFEGGFEKCGGVGEERCYGAAVDEIKALRGRGPGGAVFEIGSGAEGAVCGNTMKEMRTSSFFL
ncbi:hypothetical protein BP6252_10396 [Coleophoma cylindrospora]|uniref:Uncharacterized protein n=1 Tax=Coleophoma cylindrospora TaxID=1849047 RepID=A0A3D8QSG7_9HELO|nr:hypothetical protein BP6252_10396 [Coleophoma cylindrospora]